MLGGSVTRNSILLGLFAMFTTAIIAGTYLGSRDRIKANIRAAEEKALLEIIPEESHDNAMLDDTFTVSDQSLLGLREARDAYIARRDGEVVGVIIPAVARDGYTGDIGMIVGINRDGSIAGVRVLEHRETPGLGDAVDRKKSDWVEGFQGKSLENPKAEGWAVKKDGGVFDQFTGATITPRAVTGAVYRALQYYAQNREAIIKNAQTTEGQESADE